MRQPCCERRSLTWSFARVLNLTKYIAYGLNFESCCAKNQIKNHYPYTENFIFSSKSI